VLLRGGENDSCNGLKSNLCILRLRSGLTAGLRAASEYRIGSGFERAGLRAGYVALCDDMVG
jgi:hypothetical protein